MKKIQLKCVESRVPQFSPEGGIKREADGNVAWTVVPMNYKHELQTILFSTPLGQGFTIEHVRRADRILKALEETPSNCALYLDEADWQYLCSVLEAARFRAPLAGVVEMMDDLKHAPTEAPKPKDEKTEPKS